MSWYSDRPYISVAQRRAKAGKEAAKLAKKGIKTDPVIIQGRAIATTFWGKAWCQNLEAYGDYANRLPRGRTYARNGSVIDLQVTSGRVEALVQGSSLYKIEVRISPLSRTRWKAFVKGAAGKITNLLDLLQGRLSKDLLATITAQGDGLFPSPKEIKLACSCPDWAGMCKHVAAVLYGVGARLDTRAELFFTLRGVEMQDLIAAAGEHAAAPLNAESAATLDAGDLSDIFGVEIDASPESAAKAESSAVKQPARKRGAAKNARLKKLPTPGKVSSKPSRKPAHPASKSVSAPSKKSPPGNKPRKKAKERTS